MDTVLTRTAETPEIRLPRPQSGVAGRVWRRLLLAMVPQRPHKVRSTEGDAMPDWLRYPFP